MEKHYVTSDQARLLKEKQFNVYTKASYFGDGKFCPDISCINSNPEDEPFVSAPEHWQVIEWFLTEHKLWLTVDIGGTGLWFWKVRTIDKEVCIADKTNDTVFSILTDLLVSNTKYLKYNTPHEACSSGITYIITKLI